MHVMVNYYAIKPSRNGQIKSPDSSLDFILISLNTTQVATALRTHSLQRAGKQATPTRPRVAFTRAGGAAHSDWPVAETQLRTE
jgi:hypothetical protein